MFNPPLDTEAVPSSNPLTPSFTVPFSGHHLCFSSPLYLVTLYYLFIKMMEGSKNRSQRFLKIKGENLWEIFRTGLTQLHNECFMPSDGSYSWWWCFYFVAVVVLLLLLDAYQGFVSTVITFVIATSKYLLYVKGFK